MRLNDISSNLYSSFHTRKSSLEIKLPSYLIYKLAEKNGLSLFETHRGYLPGRNWPVIVNCEAELIKLLNQINPRVNKSFPQYGMSLIYVLSQRGEIISEERKFGIEETNHNALASKVFMAGDIYVERGDDVGFLGCLIVNNKSGSFYPHDPMNFLFLCLILLKFGMAEYANLHNFKLRFDFLSIDKDGKEVIKNNVLNILQHLQKDDIDGYLINLSGCKSLNLFDT